MPWSDAADRAAYKRRHYEANAAIYKRRAVEHRRVQRAKLRQIVIDIKTGAACADCGIEYDHWILDFDHVGDDKAAHVADLVSRAVSVDRLMAEIAKCEIVCANCHRTRTWIRRQS